MENKPQNSPKSFGDDKGKDTKKDYSKRLYSILSKEPMSRRMAATMLGFTDQTYMVTQLINDWIKNDKAAVIGVIKCARSGRKVEMITTNPELFKSESINDFELPY
jgi:hypothetical protein